MGSGAFKFTPRPFCDSTSFMRLEFLFLDSFFPDRHMGHWVYFFFCVRGEDESDSGDVVDIASRGEASFRRNRVYGYAKGSDP